MYNAQKTLYWPVHSGTVAFTQNCFYKCDMYTVGKLSGLQLRAWSSGDNYPPSTADNFPLFNPVMTFVIGLQNSEWCCQNFAQATMLNLCLSSQLVVTVSPLFIEHWERQQLAHDNCYSTCQKVLHSVNYLCGYPDCTVSLSSIVFFNLNIHHIWFVLQDFWQKRNLAFMTRIDCSSWLGTLLFG